MNKYIVFVLVSVLIFYVPVSAYGSSGHHKKCTQLWVFTFPVQKGPCVHFTHPTGAALTRANYANIRFNSGVEAATNSNATTSAKCPSSDKSYCEGWISVIKYRR